jgi:tetratricopeptide (TPR) repeat protein
MLLVTVRRHLTGAFAHFRLCADLLDLPLQVSNGSLEIPYNEKNLQAAEKYLSALRKIDTAAKVKPDYLFYLGDAATKLKNLPEAEEAFAEYLQTAKDPAGKAKVLLTLGAVKISAHKPDEAQRIAEEIMVLQPEGRVNA